MTREEWLQKATDELRIAIKAAGYDCPPVHVSVGWPSKGATSVKRRIIGQCWNGSLSSDGTPHLFISPTLTTTDDLLSVLLHEMIHATVGTKCGHKGAFIVLARAVGFTKPWRSTPMGEALQKAIVTTGGRMPILAFPNITPGETLKPQKTRYRLYECACPNKIRHAGDNLRADCLDCSSPFVKQEGAK